jgi:4-hydroxybenzoate polyprenyltransferase
MPSAIGVPKAILFSRTLHVIAVGCLAVVVSTQPLGTGAAIVQAVLWSGVAFVAAMLVWEHRMVKADDLTKLDAAFFTMNGIISLGFLTVFAVARFLASGSVA